MESLRQLREKQWAIKVEVTGAHQSRGNQPPRTGDNAKFSPGALVILEYDVQILQIMHAQNFPAAHSRIHAALKRWRN